MLKDLPIFLGQVNDEEGSDVGVDAISLVPNPAYQKNFIAFNEHKAMLSIESEDKRIISGALMLADVPVFRNNPPFGEHYLVFDKANIQKAAQRFFKQGLQSKINLSHSDFVGGVTLFESYLVDRSQNKLPMKGFEDAKDGSWFGSMKVDNLEVWKSIKAGELQGFSIEGLIRYEQKLQEQPQDSVLEQIKKILSEVE